MTTREEWLNAATSHLRTLIADKAHTLPDNVKVSCGFPSRSAISRKKARIGECWGFEASEGKVFEIFISPVLAEPVRVLGVLAHECVHAAVGLKASHGPQFKKLATALGLEGKMTATTEGPEFKAWALGVLESLGAYPHAKLNATKAESTGPKKQSTRLLKCECPMCGYTVRTTQKWLDAKGAPHCPEHGQMEIEL